MPRISIEPPATLRVTRNGVTVLFDSLQKNRPRTVKRAANANQRIANAMFIRHPLWREIIAPQPGPRRPWPADPPSVGWGLLVTKRFYAVFQAEELRDKHKAFSPISHPPNRMRGDRVGRGGFEPPTLCTKGTCPVFEDQKTQLVLSLDRSTLKRRYCISPGPSRSSSRIAKRIRRP